MVSKLLSRIRGLRVIQRLALLCAIAFAPCAVVCAILWTETQEDFRFTQRELDGQAYLSAIWPLAASAGLGLAGADDPRHDNRVAAFEAANDAYARQFGVQAQAEELLAAIRSDNREDVDNHNVLEASLQLMEAVSDRSNLVLDPKLDSYYAMDLVVNRLPELVIAAEELRHGAQLGPEGQAELLLAAGRLLPALRAAEASLLRYRLYVEHGEASPDLESADDQLGFALEDLTAATAAMVSGVAVTEAEAAGMAAFRAQVMADTLWRYCAEELHRLLQDRMRRDTQRLTFALLIFGLSMVGTLACMVFMARSIVGPQRRLVGAMQAVAGGDLQSIVPYRSDASEIGEVARAVEFFRCALIDREMMTRDLEGQRDALEARVDARTQELVLAKGHAEAAFAAMSEALRAASAGMWRQNTQTRAFWSSDAYRAITGTGESILTCAHPDDLPQILAALARAEKGENGRDFEFRIMRRDGEVRWLNISWHWLNAVEVVGLIIDITARKQQEIAIIDAHARAEEALRLLAQALATVSAGVWGYNAHTRQVWSSPEVEAQFGLPIKPETLVNKIWRAFHPDDHDMVRAALAQGIAMDHCAGFDARFIHGKTGAVGWLSLSWRRQPDGNIIGLLMDVTARKEAALELARAREAADAANTAKTAFLATMSHEIRTPLNGILGMSEGLARTPLDTRQSMMLGVIRDAGELLLGVLNDVLDLSQIEAGAMRIERAPLHLPATLNAAAALFQETAAAKGVRLSLDMEPDACGTIMGDALRLRQIVQNLISNAVKFTEKGSVTVRATVETRDGGGETLAVSVTDTGIGMTPEQAARVFERFSQAEVGIARRYGGSGLGLTISRDLARMMNGDIALESQEGVGTSFTLRIPLERVDPRQPTPLRDGLDAEIGKDSQMLKLLLVDDNAMNRLVMHTLLEPMQLSTAFAENGEQAVAMAEAQAFDAIFMDLHMPVMDGLTAARTIRGGGGINARTPIIALTADTMREQIARCLEAGMNDHVAKPIRPEALFAALSRALDPEAACDAASDSQAAQGR